MIFRLCMKVIANLAVKALRTLHVSCANKKSESETKQIRVVHLNRKRHWSQLVAMPSSRSSGSEGSQVSLRDVQFQFFTRRFLDELVCGQHEVLGRGASQDAAYSTGGRA